MWQFWRKQAAIVKAREKAVLKHQQQAHLKKLGEGIGEKYVLRAGCEEGVGCKKKDSVSDIALHPLPQGPKTTMARCWETRSVCRIPNRGKWPSSNMDALTAVLPSLLQAGCCLQPTAKPGIQAGLRALRGRGGKG